MSVKSNFLLRATDLQLERATFAVLKLIKLIKWEPTCNNEFTFVIFFLHAQPKNVTSIWFNVREGDWAKILKKKVFKSQFTMLLNG